MTTVYSFWVNQSQGPFRLHKLHKVILVFVHQSRVMVELSSFSFWLHNDILVFILGLYKRMQTYRVLEWGGSLYVPHRIA